MENDYDLLSAVFLCVSPHLLETPSGCAVCVCSHDVSASVCVCPRPSLDISLARTWLRRLGGWEACGKRQLRRVKTFFMDGFLRRSGGTGEKREKKKEWEVNEQRGEAGVEGG